MRPGALLPKPPMKSFWTWQITEWEAEKCYGLGREKCPDFTEGVKGGGSQMSQIIEGSSGDLLRSEILQGQQTFSNRNVWDTEFGYRCNRSESSGEKVIRSGLFIWDWNKGGERERWRWMGKTSMGNGEELERERPAECRQAAGWYTSPVKPCLFIKFYS